ncbi:MAG: translocation/assembly module TamB domain-containing protein [Nitrospirae bacterium]|nr:translocation/assembly module TamB domain-containing protein [Nitrospirota bacterium]MCL5976758.1 translocation/assembly module TamB domain-containing protein [Nitrospirota bacterium]
MKKRVIYIILSALFLGIFFYALRGPDISNTLKKLILPELELATGKKFIAQKIYINLIPLFVEMKNVKAFDENGDRVLTAERVKGYIGLSGLLRKEIVIKRLAIKGLELHSSSEKIDEIVQSIKKYLAEESKIPFKVIIKSIDIAHSGISVQYSGAKPALISIKDIDAEIILSDTPRFRISSKGIEFIKEGIPEFSGKLESYFFLKDNLIDMKALKLSYHDSEIKASGVFDTDKSSGEFKTDINLLAESAKKLFGLKNKGEGRVSAQGSVKFDSLKSYDKIFIDMKLKGDMYLETLMELLEVEEKLEGRLSFAGELKGNLNNLRGAAKADLDKGNLFDVDVDRLTCNVSYHDRTMMFTGGNARLYKGTADVEAMIKLPDVNYYSFKVKARDVSSRGVFKLIDWDPGIPEGRVNGEIASSGSEFNPYGTFHYKSSPKGRDILDRVKEIKGEFNMRNDIVYFQGMQIFTYRSNASAKGSVNLADNTLNFTGAGTTSDINEFSSPYFTALSGSGNFNLSVSGTLEDPALGLSLASSAMSFSTGKLGIPDVLKHRVLNFSFVEGILTYKKNLLSIKNFAARALKETYKASGNVHFKKARYLFDLKEPDYDLTIAAQNIDANALSGTFDGSPQFAGILNSDFRLYGKPEDIRASGEIRAKNISLNGRYSADDVDGKLSYAKKSFSSDNLKIKKGASLVNVSGALGLDKRFSFAATGHRIKIGDILPEKFKAENTRTKIVESFFLTDARIKGGGTLENPDIEIKSGITGISYKGYSIGKGSIDGKLSNKHLNLTAGLLDGKMSIKGGADLTGTMPWSASIELQPARYDFIIAGILKDTPDDLLLNLTGKIKAYGDRDHVNATVTISRAHLYLYGIGFTNSADVTARIDDGRLSIGSLSMKSEAAEVQLSGGLHIGKSYDLLLEGSSSLAPLKAISKTMDIVRGDASFVFSVTGDWDKPRINGGMDVSGGALGFKDINYRLTSLSAYVYVDEDRVVIERATGKLSGGDVSILGTAYLQRFSVKRFFLESRLNGITASVSRDFWVSFDGNLYYRGTMESQTLLGDVSVKRAKYTERIEWKSWLLKARPKEKPKIDSTKLDKTNLNIKVSGSNLTVDNNVARAALKMDILLKGTIGQPVILGKVDAHEGVVYFRNNEFKALKASVDFSNPNRINPYFDMVAETRVKNYNIRLSLNGYVEQFNLALSSDPVLNETDIFSLLTVGQIGKHLKGLEGGIGAGEATSFITGRIQDVFEERLKTITGIDRVQVDPYVSKTTGTVTPRVTVAKRLMGDKLYVTYSTSVATGEEQVLKLEYALGKNTSLIGVRDERGGVGGDIKFRFGFK